MTPFPITPNGPLKSASPRPLPLGAQLALFFGLLPSAAFAQLGAFTATYNFANTTTSSGQIDPTAPPSVFGMTFSPFSAHGVSANSTAAGRFAYSGWNTITPGPDMSRYYEMTLTPLAGNQLDVDDITFGVRRTGTGPRDLSIRSSLDGFAADLGIASATSAEISTAGDVFHFNNDIAPTANINGNAIKLSSDFDAITAPITFRFYAANPESNAGSLTVDDVTVNGFTAVPEPQEYALAAAGGLMLFGVYRRRKAAAGTDPAEKSNCPPTEKSGVSAAHPAKCGH